MSIRLIVQQVVFVTTPRYVGDEDLLVNVPVRPSKLTCPSSKPGVLYVNL